MEKDWKLKFRYGKIKTLYKHFTLVANGFVEDLVEGFECPKGNAYMGIKIWGESEDEANDVIQSISQQIGFIITGNIEIFETEPVQPPEENPSGYDIQFTPF
jgi:hypothetical protein